MLLQDVVVVGWNCYFPFFHFLFSVHFCTEKILLAEGLLGCFELGLFGNWRFSVDFACIFCLALSLYSCFPLFHFFPLSFLAILLYSTLLYSTLSLHNASQSDYAKRKKQKKNKKQTNKKNPIKKTRLFIVNTLVAYCHRSMTLWRTKRRESKKKRYYLFKDHVNGQF